MEHRNYIHLRKAALFLVRRQQTFLFLKNCKQLQTLPRTFRFQRNYVGFDASRVLHRTGFILLSKAVRRSRRDFFKMQRRYFSIRQQMDNQGILSENIIGEVEAFQQGLRERLSDHYNKKIDWLLRLDGRYYNMPVPTYCINLSSKTLTETQLEILNKGPHHILETNEGNKEILAADFECAVRAVPIESRSSLREELADRLKRLQIVPDPNTRKIKDELTSLKRDPEIMICRADKTPHIVICDRIDIVEKVEKFVEDNECVRVNENPMQALKEKVRRQVNNLDWCTYLKEKGKPPDAVRVPELFVRIKTHKTGNPIRPMAPRFCHPTYNLETAFIKYFGSIANNHEWKVKSTKHFVDKITTNLEGKSEYVFITADVKSMYPSINTSFAIGLARMLIMESEDFDLNVIQLGDIYQLLRLMVENNHFVFQGTIYHQTRGVPIGGVISGLLAEITMQYLEKRILVKPSIKENLLFYARYADDIAVAWKGDANKVQDIFQQMSAIRPEITFDIQTCGKIMNFLDTTVTSTGTTCKIEIYRKPTHLPKLQPWNNSMPRWLLATTLRPLYHRAYLLINDRENLIKELNYLSLQARSFGYPWEMVEKIRNQARKAVFRNARTNEEDRTIQYRAINNSTLTPIVGSLLRPHNISIVSKIKSSLWDYVRKDRDQVNKIMRPGVYSITLKLPDDTLGLYIGRTKRTIATRRLDHQKDIENGRVTCGLSAAVILDGATPNWDELHLIQETSSVIRSSVLEALNIAKTRTTTVNLQQDSQKHSEWVRAVRDTWE